MAARNVLSMCDDWDESPGKLRSSDLKVVET